jgi:microcystin-dependent protein
MTSLYPVDQPIPVYFDTDGKPLDAGFVWFGVANQNPESNPFTTYWDSAGTIPTERPLRTVNGYIARNGTPAKVYASGSFSVTVKNSKGSLVFTTPVSQQQEFADAVFTAGTTAAAVPIADAGGYFTTDNVEAALQQLGPLLAALSGAITGETKDYPGKPDATPQTQGAPSGYVWSHGNTIGNAASGADRANADTEALFTLLYNNWSNTQLPIRNSDGSAGSRTTASADYAANKRLPTPDCRGRARVGFDQAVKPVGGGVGSEAIAGRLTASGSGITGTTQGATGGVETHALTGPQTGAHTHTFTGTAHSHTATQPAHNHSYNNTNTSNYLNVPASGGNPVNAGATSGTTGNANPAITVANATAGGTISTTSASTAHQNTQPSIVFSVIIKL